MKHLDIWDRIGPQLSIELRDILPTLTARARASRWEVDDFVEPNGQRNFETVADGRDMVRDAAEAHSRVSFLELIEMVACVRQVIWASFKAFDALVDEPWMVLNAVDSTFWRVETKDIPVRQAILRGFKDVRLGTP